MSEAAARCSWRLDCARIPAISPRRVSRASRSRNLASHVFLDLKTIPLLSSATTPEHVAVWSRHRRTSASIGSKHGIESLWIGTTASFNRRRRRWTVWINTSIATGANVRWRRRRRRRRSFRRDTSSIIGAQAWRQLVRRRRFDITTTRGKPLRRRRCCTDEPANGKQPVRRRVFPNTEQQQQRRRQQPVRQQHQQCEPFPVRPASEAGRPERRTCLVRPKRSTTATGVL